MFKVKFSLVSDIIFSFFCFFILCLIILNYFLPLIYAIILSFWFSAFFTLLLSRRMINKQKSASLTKSQNIECENTLTALNFMSNFKATEHFYTALKKKHPNAQKIRGAISCNKTLYFINFSFEGVTQTDLVRYYNRLAEKESAVVCSEDFTAKVKDFAKRFNKPIELMDGKSCYLLLKDGDALPKSVSCLNTDKPKKALFCGFPARKNAKKVFLFGVSLCLLSFISPFKLYYSIFGSAFLFWAVMLKLFGKSPAQNVNG